MTTLLLYICIGAVGIFIYIKIFQALNSEKGEKYIRSRMQGPFVPIDEDEENDKKAPAKES